VLRYSGGRRALRRWTLLFLQSRSDVLVACCGGNRNGDWIASGCVVDELLVDPSNHLPFCCTVIRRRARWTRCSPVRASWPGEANSGDSNAADRTSLPPEAAESHTHLAHAVIRYLGLTAPEELAPFGINSAAGIVDLISQVRLRLGLPFRSFSDGLFFFVVCNEFHHAHITIVGTTGGLRFSAGCAGQSFV
jgi:hypothetical protein